MNQYTHILRIPVIIVFFAATAFVAPQQTGSQNDPVYEPSRWVSVPELPRRLAVYESVFWYPSETDVLRPLMLKEPRFKDARVLEIGTGTGLLALCALEAGSAFVVATDINPAAIANARYNAWLFGYNDRFEARQVIENEPEAYAVVDSSETFDIIITNPPWEAGTPEDMASRARYDPDFRLLISFIRGLRSHLNQGGTAYIVLGNTDAINFVLDLAYQNNLQMTKLDYREIWEYSGEFVPAMLFELRPREFD